MSVLQYRLSTRVSNGRAEVLCRFFSGRDFSQRAKCRIFCPVSAWNNKEQRLSIPKRITPQVAELTEIQRKLDELRDHIYSHWWKEQYNAHSGWLQKTIDEFMNISHTERKRMPDIVTEYADYKNPSPRMRDQYEVIRRIFEEYEKIHEYLYADEFTPDVVRRVIDYYKTRPVRSKGGVKEMTRSTNTVASKEKVISRICSYAVHNGYMTSSPFGKRDSGLYQTSAEMYGDIVYLTQEERDHLATYPFDDRLKEVVRDIFIFQCHVGCRVSDLLSLTPDNIQGDYIQYIPIKTRSVSSRVVRNPLDKAAQEIIDKYKGGKKLLPEINDSIYNKYIHIIAREAGLNRKVIVLKDKEQVTRELWQVCTSHIARKTFSQMIFRSTHSEIVAASFTGHSPNTRVFSRYAQVDDDIKRDIIDKLTTN